jgi:hypothetical protein
VKPVARAATCRTNAVANPSRAWCNAELIRRRPWRGFNDVEYETLEYINWFNNHRPHGEIGMTLLLSSRFAIPKRRPRMSGNYAPDVRTAQSPVARHRTWLTEVGALDAADEPTRSNLASDTDSQPSQRHDPTAVQKASEYCNSVPCLVCIPISYGVPSQRSRLLS